MAKGPKKPQGAPSLRVVSGGRSEPADKPARASGRKSKDTVGKRVQFDIETWQAVDLLGRDSMMTFQELADEAFRDLLRKHGRPFDLKDALKRSAAGDAPPKPEGGKGEKQRR